MTSPAPDTIEREQADFVSDTEIARRWRVSEKTARVAIHAFEKDPLFPKKDPLFGNRRYWRKVKLYMDLRYGVIAPSAGASLVPDGEEDLNARPSNNRRRARPAVAPAR